MRCKHLPQDNANVSITYAKQKHKSLCLKNRIRERERDREREIEYQQRLSIERDVKERLSTFWIVQHFMTKQRNVKPIEIFHPDFLRLFKKPRLSSNFRHAWLHPIEIFHSADVSPPRDPTKKPRLSANLRRPCQFACSTLLNRLQSCPQKTSVLLKTCQMKHQTMHFEVAECFHGWWVIEQ